MPVCTLILLQAEAPALVVAVLVAGQLKGQLEIAASG